MFKSTGFLVVESRFMFLQCDTGLSKYYRSLARTRGIYLVPQRHDSHVSVIRTEELKEGQFLPKSYAGMEIEFTYNPEYIQCNARHYWFRILSPELEYVRMRLGFCSQPVEVLDDGIIFTHPFHFTIGRIYGT